MKTEKPRIDNYSCAYSIGRNSKIYAEFLKLSTGRPDQREDGAHFTLEGDVGAAVLNNDENHIYVQIKRNSPLMPIDVHRVIIENGLRRMLHGGPSLESAAIEVGWLHPSIDEDGEQLQ